MSTEAVRRCIDHFADDLTKSFPRYEQGAIADPAGWLRADLALSLEVIFHLIDDGMFEEYLTTLFDSAGRYVVICSSDTADLPEGPHEKHRPFTPWVERNQPDWTLTRRLEPPAEIGMVSSLYLYERSGPET